MSDPDEIRVIRRNLRWEVSTAGLTRPMVDWLCTRERAIDHARERAREVGASVVVVERWDGTIEEVVPVEHAPPSRVYLAVS